MVKIGVIEAQSHGSAANFQFETIGGASRAAKHEVTMNGTASILAAVLETPTHILRFGAE